MNILKHLVIMALSSSVIFHANTIRAEGTIEKNDTSAQIDKSNTVSTARTAHIDPNTGELISTPAESNTKLPTANVTQGSLPAVEILYHSNGTVQAKLNGRFRTPLVAQIDCEGKITMAHAENGKVEAIDCGELK